MKRCEESVLLSEEEWNAAAEKGIAKWLRQLTEPSAFESSAPFAYAEVCRAQVRKVVEWLRQHDGTPSEFADSEEDTENVIIERGDLWVAINDWNVVKSAAEGDE